jgi:molybdopterin synthase sulfur carrier subunit
MKIRILTFGIARDIVGAGSFELELPTGSNVADVQSALESRFPGFKKLESLMIAVNTEYAAAETIVQERDEVALIPPVSGG